jgi:hypothetical protein
MNSKSTLALVLVAAVAGLWLWKGDEWGPKIGLKTSQTEPSSSSAATALDSLTPASLTRIEVVYDSGAPLVLERAGTDSGWKLPGNWPPRKAEVEELVEVLGNLRTRFQAIAITDDADLAKFGLAPEQKKQEIKLTAGGQIIALTFGDPSPSDGETTFTRPAFVRVNGSQEVFQLGPEVMPVVRRSPDAYRRRQLFTDVERVRITASMSPPSPFAPPQGAEAPITITLPGVETSSIQVSRAPVHFFGISLSPTYDFTLARIGKLPEPAIYTKGGEPIVPQDRIADAWSLNAPIKDHVEPGRLRSLLAALSDLWADEFVTPTSDIRMEIARQFTMHLPLATIASAAAHAAPIPFDVRTGLAESKLAITVKQNRGESVTVRFGHVAKTGERSETIAMPGSPPGTPPPTITQKIVYRFAKIDGDPQVFVVSAEKFPDLFTTVEQLTDPQVARYSADEVQEVVIRHSGSPEVKLQRKKGNPKATNLAETQDRWSLDAKPNPLPADAARVSELLDQLASFRSSGAEQITYPKTAPAADTLITIVVREKRSEDEPEAPPRTIQLQIGKPDANKHLLPVQLEGWPRVTMVNDKLGSDELESWISAILIPKTVSGLLARPPLAYRGRKLFDTADTSLSSVTVAAASGGFALYKDDAGNWKLTAPLQSEADPGKAAQLAMTLSGLESTEYLADAPIPDKLKEFGLDKPAQTVSLGFSGGRTYKLELGGPRPSKPEVFARLDGGGVFGLPTTVVDQLTTGVVGLLPLRVWAALPEKVTGLEIKRTGDAAKLSFALVKDGNDWKLTGAFTAPVTFLNAQPLLAALGSLQAVKYQALAVRNAADFGFDKPLLHLKLSFLEKKPAPPGNMPKDEEQSVTKTLVVGGSTPDGGNRYAMLEAPNAPVFVIPAEFIFAAQTPPLDLLDRSLLFLDQSRIAKVRVTPGKPEDAFSLIKDEKGKWSAEGVSFAVDAERIAQLTFTIGALPVIRLEAYGEAIKWSDYGLDKPPTIAVTLSGEKPQTRTITLGNMDPAGSQFVRVDEGKAVGVMPAQAAEFLSRRKFDFADRTLMTFDPTTLVGLNRKQGKDELELLPAAAIGWDVVKPAKFKADQMFVEELADNLGRLRAEKVAAYGKKEEIYKQYGLDMPRAVLTLTIGDKAEQKILRLGNPFDPAKPDGDRYAAVETTNPETSVGVLPAILTNKLLAKDVAFRDHTLAKFVDADKAILERGDRKITFAKVGVTWKVTEPLAAAAEYAELEALIADFGKLRVDTWVEKKTGDLKAFGLDKPEAKWIIFDGDKQVLTLLLGKKEPDGRVNVTTDKSELVGLLDPIMTARVLSEYRTRRPWEVDAAQVAAVEIVKSGTKFDLQKGGPVWFDVSKPADQIDVRVVNELLGTLGALRVDRYAVDKDADPKLFGLENPEMKLTVTSQGGMRKVLEIGAAVGGTDGKQRYARVADKDRTDVFILTAADTMRLTRDRAVYVMKK